MRNRATTPLSKAKVRQSWSKYNLYNLSRIATPVWRNKTFFQQKWLAKSVLRSYHGEQVREAQWTKMFRRRLKGVVPMNPEYLAVNDGSRESAGRGSGLDLETEQQVQQTPYMQMTFSPLERRLDTAIFRAMFASSTRQARQFVVHGAVKVNGKKMQYPGYLLNPGDMFQVDAERVMYATGVQKEIQVVPKIQEAEQEGDDVKEAAENTQEITKDEEEPEVDIDQDPREVLKSLQAQAKSILSSERTNIGAKKKQDLRGFTKAVKRMLSRSKSSTILTDSLEAQFEELKHQLKIQKENKKGNRPSPPSEQKGDDVNAKAEADSPKAKKEDFVTLSDRDYNELFAALSESVENPIDDSKPYATPWRPRNYMSAFAFIPRYLEVNQNICAAVYLRHPVARPGSAEVPTPYSQDTSASAFAWYLRRR